MAQQGDVALEAAAGTSAWLELSAEALAANLARLRGLLPISCGLMAVLKSAAYGHGLREVGELCWRHGVRSFGVTHVDEALALRQQWPHADISLIGPFIPAWAEEIVRHDIHAQLDGLPALRALAAAATGQGRVGHFSIKYDSGMSRLGCDVAGLDGLLAAAQAEPFLRLRGLVSHIACADHEDPGSAEAQIARFRALIQQLGGRGVALPCNHIANSAATLRFAAARLDQVRCGIALYGIAPAPAMRRDPVAGGLRPLLRGRSRVVQVHEVEAGQGVGYGHRWIAPRRSRIGIIPVGYADGYRRLIPGERRAMSWHDRLLPLAGQVCMNMTMVDLTDAPAIGVGTAVTWLSDDPDSPLSAESLAAAWGTIPYEVVTGLAAQLPRFTRPSDFQKV